METVVVEMDGVALIVSLSWPILIALAVVACLAIAVRRGWVWRNRRDFEIDEAELGIGQQKLKLRANRDDLRVAYQLWVELSTRKIGLPLDFDHDVIAEVYDSWYQFFGVTRELIKDLPPSKLRGNESMRNLIQLAIEVLNNGLRPHLTRWQARFRRWYGQQLEHAEKRGSSPQELQRAFPEYAQLRDDMERVNAHLIYYRNQLGDFVFGEGKRPEPGGM